MRHMFGIVPLPHLLRSEAFLRGGNPFSIEPLLSGRKCLG